MADTLLDATDRLHENRAQTDGIGAEEKHLDGMQPRLNATIGHEFCLLAQATPGQHQVGHLHPVLHWQAAILDGVER